MLSFIFKVIESSALACATCGTNDESNFYYLKMVVIMTTVPVILVGSTIYFLRKHGGKNDSHEK